MYACCVYQAYICSVRLRFWIWLAGLLAGLLAGWGFPENVPLASSMGAHHYTHSIHTVPFHSGTCVYYLLCMYRVYRVLYIMSKTNYPVDPPLSPPPDLVRVHTEHTIGAYVANRQCKNIHKQVKVSVSYSMTVVKTKEGLKGPVPSSCKRRKKLPTGPCHFATPCHYVRL